MDRSEVASPKLTQRDSWIVPVLILIVNRIGVMLIAYLGLAVLVGPPKITGNALPGNLFLDGWTRWDAHWYARIAIEGHTNRSLNDTNQTDAVHFPFYPLVVRAAAMLIGDVYVAGILVSNVSFVLAGWVLFRLIERQFNSEVARRAIILWSVWPFSYTFSAMYTESLFVLCSAVAFSAAMSSRWWLASIAAGLSSFTRVVGMATAAAVGIRYLQDRAVRGRWFDRQALWLPLGAGGLIAFMVLLWIKFGDPLLFIKAQSAVGWSEFNTFSELQRSVNSLIGASFGNIASGNIPLLHLGHITSLLIAIVLTIASIKKLPPAWTVWLALVVFISATRWACFGRHFATCWPAFVTAALLLRNRFAFDAAVYISALLLALLTIMFTHGYWVA